MKYIHIGFSRTGTTWLQKLVFPEWMKDNNVAFFNLMAVPDFHQLPSRKVLISGEIIAAHPLLTDTVERALQNMVDLFGNVKVVISNRGAKEVAESINDSLKCSFNPPNVPIRDITEHDVMKHQAKVYAWLLMNKVPFIEIRLKTFKGDCGRLAEFMGIKEPTAEQISRWLDTKINQRFSKWLLVIIKILYKWKWHRVRKTVLLVRLIVKKFIW